MSYWHFVAIACGSFHNICFSMAWDQSVARPAEGVCYGTRFDLLTFASTCHPYHSRPVMHQDSRCFDLLKDLKHMAYYK